MYVSIILALIIIVIGFLISSKQKKKNIQEVRNIPGPKPANNQQGNIPDIVQAGSLYSFLSDIHSRYGPVVQFWFGNKPCVSTCSPAAYKDQIKIFNKPDDAMKFMSPVFGSRCIQFVNGEEAKIRRQKYDEYLGTFYIRKYIPTFRQIINNLSRTLNPNNNFNVYNNMFHCSLKATGCTMFGNYFENDDNVESFRCLYTKFWPLLEENFTQRLPSEGSEERKEFDESINQTNWTVMIHLMTEKQLFGSSKDREKSGDRKFIDVVMETGHDTESINGDILSYLVGGFHSTSVSLTWCLYFAGKYPHLQEKIHQEVAKVVRTCGENIEEHISELKYLKQYLNETLRIRFVAPITNRAAEKGTKICGYDIPTGTGILQALSVTMTDEKLWPDPKRFDPDRFNSENSLGRKPLTFCPFGFAGKRMCPGQRFFYTEALIFLGTLFHKFEFKLITDDDVNITYGLLTRPADDILMSVKKR